MLCICRIESVSLSAELKKRVLDIGSVVNDYAEREAKAGKLLKDVPCEFTFTSFGVGGWFRTTTSCKSSCDFAVEEAYKTASNKNRNAFFSQCAPILTGDAEDGSGSGRLRI